MTRKLSLIILFLFSASGFSQENKLFDRIKSSFSQANPGKAYVTVQELGYEFKNLPANVAELTRDNYQSDLKFKAADKKEVFYFDHQGKLTDKAQKDGFYREILGQDDQGRPVVQDFYGDNSKAQSAPFVVRAGQEKNFNANSAEGRIAAFAKDGKLLQIAEFRDGKNLWLGQFNRPTQLDYFEAAQPKDKLWQIFFKNGKPQVVISLSDENMFILDGQQRTVSAALGDDIIYFAENGQPLVRIHGKEPIAAWDNAGKALARTQDYDREKVNKINVILQESMDLLNSSSK